MATEEQRERARQRARAWRAANPEHAAKLARQSQAKRKERWGEFLAQERQRYRRNREKILTRQARRREEEPEAHKEVMRRFYRNHPHKAVAACAAYRAAKRRAKPAWVKRRDLEPIYAQAKALTKQTGVQHEVDHIIPLAGRDVCGLHVPWNLQIITRAENRRKHNRAPHAGGVAGL